MKACRECGGTGICGECDGSGLAKHGLLGLDLIDDICHHCSGTGKCPCSAE